MADEIRKFIELNQRNRCIKCKNQIEEAATCKRCLQFKYCSMQCLENDHQSHMYYCDIISLMERTKIDNDGGHVQTVLKTSGGQAEEENSDMGSDHCRSKSGKKKKNKNKHGGGKNKINTTNGIFSKIKYNDRNMPDERAVESLVAGGGFDGATKLSPKEESGKVFGEGWWKPYSKITKTGCLPTGKLLEVETGSSDAGDASAAESLGVKALTTAVSSGLEVSSSTNIKLTFKDFYSDSEDEVDHDLLETKVKKDPHPDTSAIPDSGTPLKPGTEIVKYDPQMSDKQIDRGGSKGSSRQGICSYCKKKGHVLVCSRCKMSSYCNRTCQTTDYSRHKHFCRLKEKYDIALHKVPRLIKMVMMFYRGTTDISPLLSHVPNPFQRMLLGPQIVMLEIVEQHVNMLGEYIIVVRDLSGAITCILFQTDETFYVNIAETIWNTPICTRIPLTICIKPGNFIILFDPYWQMFLNGTRGIILNDLDNIQFIFMN